MEWPKLILVRGIQVPISSWEELDELVEKYGGEALVVTTPQGDASRPKGRKSKLDPDDRSLLEAFVEGGPRGVPTGSIGPALGAHGKGIRPALAESSPK